MIPDAQRNPWLLVSGSFTKGLGPSVVLCLLVCVRVVGTTGEIEGKVGDEGGRGVVRSLIPKDQINYFRVVHHVNISCCLFFPPWC